MDVFPKKSNHNDPKSESKKEAFVFLLLGSCCVDG